MIAPAIGSVPTEAPTIRSWLAGCHVGLRCDGHSVQPTRNRPLIRISEKCHPGAKPAPLQDGSVARPTNLALFDDSLRAHGLVAFSSVLLPAPRATHGVGGGARGCEAPPGLALFPSSLPKHARFPKTYGFMSPRFTQAYRGRPRQQAEAPGRKLRPCDTAARTAARTAGHVDDRTSLCGCGWTSSAPEAPSGKL